MTPATTARLAVASDVSVADALAIISATLRDLCVQGPGHERVPLSAAQGRVLAAQLRAPLELPPHDNAAMDGYALRSTDLAPGDSTVWPVMAGTVLAGASPSRAVPPGHCVRIMTGAAMPDGLDTVVPLESCDVIDGFLHVTRGPVMPGANCRRRGEDVARGAVALPAGRRLRAADLGVLASLSCAHVEVLPRPRVALLSTGDELRQPGQPLDVGCIYDSNRFALRAVLEGCGADVVDLGCVGDDAQALWKGLADGVIGADAIVTSASASHGDADHLAAAVSRMGGLLLQGVRMRPGKPFCFGTVHGKGRVVPIFGLPGNPVAALVCLQVLAGPALAALAGDRFWSHRSLRVRLAEPVSKRSGRTEFPRARLVQAVDGTYVAELLAEQGSASLRSLAEADALVCLPESASLIDTWQWVDAYPIPGAG